MASMNTKGEFQSAIRNALMESAFRDLVEITFDDEFVVCHQKCSPRMDFENAVGELGGIWGPIANRYGLRLVGRTDSCAIHFDDYTLRFKLVSNEAIPAKLSSNMNRVKRVLLLIAALFMALDVQADTFVVTNGMQTLVVPDSIQYVDVVVSSSNHGSELTTVQLGKAFRSFQGDNYWG